MTIRELILLRHGETDWNLQLRMQGGADICLNDTGRRQAAAAAPSVAALRPEVIVSSDLARARVTADAVAEVLGLPVRLDRRLRETSMGQWSGLTREEIIARWPAEWDAWRTTSAHNAPPGGENRLQVADRSSEVVDELDSTDVGKVLLVAHGGLIAGLTAKLLALPDELWSRLIGVGNCHWVVLHRFEKQWRLHSFNAGLGGIVLPGGEDEVAGA